MDAGDSAVEAPEAVHRDIGDLTGFAEALEVMVQPVAIERLPALVDGGP